ncbi:MAG TPA: polysaccharide deacetylase family protein, partial [Kofleriaceae bacterium]|nr:polysaccharide deacetylase family protein [Kofleriaceae bacterium]
LAHARTRELAFYTYRELAGEIPHPGIALSFDDHNVAGWTAFRPKLAEAGARVTFFVSGYAFLDEESRAQLRALAEDGHELGAHSVRHRRAPPYVENRGLSAYLTEEVLPSIAILRDDGYDVTSFAYPYGARTSELDEAILKHVRTVRTVDFPYSASVQSPCPH